MKKSGVILKYHQPSEITLFSKPYKITYFKSLGDVDTEKMCYSYGEISLRNASIRIYSKSPTERDHYQILAHEFLHAITDELSIDFKEDSEEKIIDNLALGIADILVGNGYTSKLK